MPTAAARQRQADVATGIRPPGLRVRKTDQDKAQDAEKETIEMAETNTPEHGWVAGQPVVIQVGQSWATDEIIKVTAQYVMTKDHGRFKISAFPRDRLSRNSDSTWSPTTFMYHPNSEQAVRGMHQRRLSILRAQRHAGFNNAWGNMEQAGPLYRWMHTGSRADYIIAVKWMRDQQKKAQDELVEYGKQKEAIEAAAEQAGE